MKKFRRFFSLLLALVLVIGTQSQAFAAEAAGSLNHTHYLEKKTEYRSVNDEGVHHRIIVSALYVCCECDYAFWIELENYEEEHDMGNCSLVDNYHNPLNRTHTYVYECECLKCNHTERKNDTYPCNGNCITPYSLDDLTD